jgi:hypothetical protein
LARRWVQSTFSNPGPKRHPVGVASPQTLGLTFPRVPGSTIPKYTRLRTSHSMSFGEVAFSGSRFIFWCLAPALALCAAVPLVLDDWNPTKLVVATGWSACCLLAIPALYDARRFWWAARAVTAIIFLCYLSYLVTEAFLSGKSFGPTRRSDASPFNSIVGFIVIGLPALWYTILGRFTLRKPPAEPQSSESNR